MSLIKPRTRGKQLVRHLTRLDRENNETLYAYAQFLGEPTEYVLNQVIDTVLAKDKEFLQWRADHPESHLPAPRPRARRSRRRGGAEPEARVHAASDGRRRARASPRRGDRDAATHPRTARAARHGRRARGRRVGPARVSARPEPTCFSLIVELSHPTAFLVHRVRLRDAVVHDAVPRGVRRSASLLAIVVYRHAPRVRSASAAAVPRAGDPPGPDAGARRAAFPDDGRARADAHVADDSAARALHGRR